MEESDPVALLGSFYVVEGSTNGGRFLANVLRKAWQIDGDGLRYFDPYGEDQPDKWASFKRVMDATDFADNERDTILDAACKTFEAIADVSGEVTSSRPDSQT